MRLNHSIEAYLSFNSFAMLQGNWQPPSHSYHVHVFSDIELWCFSFVTLFNLQGTRSVPCSVRNIHYLTTSFSVCQVLFSTFFKIFFRTRLAGACRSEAWISYHISLALSSTFFDSFQNLFRTQPLSRLSLESLITLPQLPAFVKPFFRFPQNFFPKPWNARASRRQLA